MTIKTVAKGNKFERIVKEMFEANGYSVEKQKNVRFQKTHDLFGVADLIAINKKHIRFIAVTDKGHRSRARKKLQSFTNHPKSLIKEVWYYYKTDENVMKFDIERVK